MKEKIPGIIDDSFVEEYKKRVKGNVCRLDNWSVCGRSEWDAPEFGIRLQGKVFDHPYHEDGHQVVTTGIVDCKGRTVYTKSGSTYKLGKIDPMFRKWLKENYKKAWDWRNPIKTINNS